MLIYLDDSQAKLMIDILEGVIRREEMTDWADFVPNPKAGHLDRIERPDLVALSKSKVKLSSDLVGEIKSMLE